PFQVSSLEPNGACRDRKGSRGPRELRLGGAWRRRRSVRLRIGPQCAKARWRLDQRQGPHEVREMFLPQVALDGPILNQQLPKAEGRQPRVALDPRSKRSGLNAKLGRGQLR